MTSCFYHFLSLFGVEKPKFPGGFSSESLGFHIIQEIDDILVAFGEQHLLIIIDWVSPLVIRYGVFS